MTAGFSMATHERTPFDGRKSCVSAEGVESVLSFHRGLPGYAPTPLVELPALAKSLGVAQILVKDESKRFGLNAFKALGCSYAIAGYLCRTFGLPLDDHTFARLRSDQYRTRLREITFVTATDGNHGRGVAWTAQTLGCRAVVYLPKGSAEERLNRILALGAEAKITDLNYDDAVRCADRMARKNGWVLIQDTAWEGYEDIPADIMRGYTTLARELEEQRLTHGWEKPTHLFLQAGVGSFAGATAGYLASRWGTDLPKIIVVEPDRADCLYRTARANDGTLHTVTGSMDSMMAGLCCGEPCPLGWNILNALACAFLSCNDTTAALGMRLLGRPLGSDPAVVSGESGAVTLGAVARLMREYALKDLRNTLRLDQTSRILLVSTEGATDRENYQKILGISST